MKFTTTQYSFIALGAALIAVASSLAVVFLVPFGKNDPAEILPADNTTVLVHNADRDTITRLNAQLQGFDAIPLPDYSVDVAILRLEGGRNGWAVFDTQSAPIGTKFSITASDTDTQKMIGKKEGALSKDETYKSFKSFLAGTSPTAYVRFPSAVLKQKATIFAPKKPISVLFEDDRIRIVLPDDNLSSLPSLFSDSVRTVLESKIRTLSSQLFGTLISPEYDLLPLIERSAIVRIQGKNSFVLTGRTQDTSKTRATLKRLHEAFASVKPGVEVVQRHLDDQFSYTGIRASDKTAQHTTESRDGFDTETSVRGGEEGGFFTAIQNPWIVLSDTLGGLEVGKNTMAETEMALVGTPVVSVLIDPVALETLFPETKEAIQWDVVRDGGRLILEIPR